MSPISAKIAAIISDIQLAINAGTNDGVALDDEVLVIELIDIKDPETQDFLGSIGVVRLRLRVNHVQARLCTAAVTTPQSSAARGVTTVRRLMRIVDSKFDEEPGVSIALAVGDSVQIEKPKAEEPPF